MHQSSWWAPSILGVIIDKRLFFDDHMAAVSIFCFFTYELCVTSERRFRMTWLGLSPTVSLDPVWTTATPFSLECWKATSTICSAYGTRLLVLGPKNKARPHQICREGASLASGTFPSVIQIGNARIQDSTNRNAGVPHTVRTSIRTNQNSSVVVTRSTSNYSYQTRHVELIVQPLLLCHVKQQTSENATPLKRSKDTSRHIYSSSLCAVHYNQKICHVPKKT